MIKYSVESSSGSKVSEGVATGLDELRLEDGQRLSLDIPAQELVSIGRHGNDLQLEAISGETLVVSNYFEHGVNLQFLFSQINSSDLQSGLTRDGVIGHSEWLDMQPLNQGVPIIGLSGSDNGGMYYKLASLDVGELFSYEFKLSQEVPLEAKIEVNINNQPIGNSSWLSLSELGEQQFGLWGYLPDEGISLNYKISIDLVIDGEKIRLETVDVQVTNKNVHAQNFNTNIGGGGSLVFQPGAGGGLGGGDLAALAIPSVAAMYTLQSFAEFETLQDGKIEDLGRIVGAVKEREQDEDESDESKKGKAKEEEESLNENQEEALLSPEEILVQQAAREIQINGNKFEPTPIEEGAVQESLPPLTQPRTDFFTDNAEVRDMNYFAKYNLTGQFIESTTMDALSGDDFVYLPTGSEYAYRWNYNAGNTFYGGEGNDVILGFTLKDKISGYVGDDIIFGGGSDDKLLGGAGDDILYGGGTQAFKYYTDTDGNDELYGDKGNDLLYGGEHGADVLYGGDDADTLDGQSGNDLLYGDAGNDTLNESAGIDQMYGGDGDDVFNMTTDNSEADLIDGGAGTGDLINYASHTLDLTVNLTSGATNNTGNDTITSVEHVTTGSGNDTITGNASDNIITTDAGDDIIYDTAGADTMYGGADIDTFHMLNNTLDADIIDGGAGALDAINYDYVNNSIDFTINLTTGVTGNTGGDTITNIEIVNTSSGNDIVTGNSSVNTITTNAGDDTIIDAAGADTLDGGNDNDTFIMADDDLNEVDVIIGGADAGIDTVDYSNENDKVILNLTAGAGTTSIGGTTGSDTMTGIENITGGSNDDTLWGDVNNNIVKGNGGNDILYGDAGDDTLQGDAGNDVLYDEAGADTLDGGDGNDTFRMTDDNSYVDTIDGGLGGYDLLDYQSETSNLIIDFTANRAYGAGDVLGNNYDIFTNIEMAQGGSGTDSIVGDAANNYLYGYLNDDTLYGGVGNDWVYGGNDADTLYGGVGVDRLYGGAGDDSLYDEAGADILDGVGDNDTFIMTDDNTDADTLYGGLGTDSINYTAETSNLTVNLATGVTTGTGGTGDVLSTDFENVSTGSGNDVITGNGSANTISGNGGEDIMYGAGGDDTFVMTDDNTYADTADGGSGTDFVDYSLETSDLTVNLETGVTTGTGGTGDVLISIENVTTGTGNDRITGDDNDNVISAGNGNDTIIGGNGGDTIAGGAGDDIIYADGQFFDYASVGGMMLWLDANDVNADGSYLSDNTVVSTWYDKSGNNYDATGVGSADINFAAMGSRASIEFNGATEYFDLSAYVANFASLSEGSVFAVFNGQNVGGYDTIIGLSDSGDASSEFSFGNEINLRSNFRNDGAWQWDNASSSYSNGQNYITSFNQTNSSGGAGALKTYSNGNNYYIDDSGAFFDDVLGVDSFLIGANDDSGAGQQWHWTGDIAEVLIFGQALTDAQIKLVHEYLSYKYEIALSGQSFGSDTLTGGTGADTFIWTNNSISNLTNTDVITDFNKAEGDKIRLDFDTMLTLGGNSFDSIGGELIWRDDGSGGTYLEADWTGNGSADFRVHLQSFNYTTMNETDFLFHRVKGTTANETFTGAELDDHILGDGGNDKIYGVAGNDTLDGGTGNDIVYGGTGDDLLLGDVGYDYLYGEAGFDTIYGGDTDDFLYGGADADTIHGDGFDDLIYGGIGNDFLYGDAGDDNVYGDGGTDILYGDAGYDNLVGGDGIDTLYGGALDDALYGGDNSSDTLYGGNGSDDLYGGLGAMDVLVGDEGNDILHYDADHSNDVLSGGWYYLYSFYGGTGTDTLDLSGYGANGLKLSMWGMGVDLGASIEVYLGTSYNESLTGAHENQNETFYMYGGVDWVDASYGDDTVYGGDGADTIYGDDGADHLYGDGGLDLVYGDAGNDVIYYDANHDDSYLTAPNYRYLYSNFFGGADIDTLDLSQLTVQSFDYLALANMDASIEVIVGSAFSDTLGGRNSVNDTMYGAEGNDTIWGWYGDDLIYGGVGSDTLRGYYGNDTLIGGAGNDYLDGQENDDTIIEFEGSGDDTYIGGTGTDTLNYTNYTSGVYVLLYSSVAWGNTGTDALYGFENLIGGAGADVLEGDTGASMIWGGSGADQIYGHYGNDILYGDAGSDQMYGYYGNDTFYGGGGTDYLYGVYGTNYFYTGSDGVVDFAYGGTGVDYFNIAGGFSDGNDYYYGGGGIDYIVLQQAAYSAAFYLNVPAWGGWAAGIYGVEGVIGYGTTDAIVASSSGSYIYGEGGNDYITAGAGTDYLYGGTGNDSFFSTDENDYYWGGTGTDTVYFSGGGNNWNFSYGQITSHYYGVEVFDFASNGVADTIYISLNDLWGDQIYMNINYGDTVYMYGYGTGATVYEFYTTNLEGVTTINGVTYYRILEMNSYGSEADADDGRMGLWINGQDKSVIATYSYVGYSAWDNLGDYVWNA